MWPWYFRRRNSYRTSWTASLWHVKNVKKCDGPEHRIPISNLHQNICILKTVRKFSCLSSIVTDNFSLDREINRWISCAATTFAWLMKKVWEHNKLTVHTKVTVYTACILNILLYSSESWTLPPVEPTTHPWHQVAWLGPYPCWTFQPLHTPPTALTPMAWPFSSHARWENSKGPAVWWASFQKESTKAAHFKYACKRDLNLLDVEKRQELVSNRDLLKRVY